MILILGAAVQLAAAQRSAAASEPVPRAPLQNFVSADDYPEGVARSAARPVGLTLTVGPGRAGHGLPDHCKQRNVAA
jgi:hypothetical protein